MTNSFRLPRNNEVVPMTKPKGNTVDIKPALENVFSKDAFLERAEPYIIGNVEGTGTAESRTIDLDRVLHIAIDLDDKMGGTIRASRLDTCAMLDQLRVVIRRHWVLGDGKNSDPSLKGKAIGVNTQRYLLIGSIPAFSAPASE